MAGGVAEIRIKTAGPGSMAYNAVPSGGCHVRSGDADRNFDVSHYHFHDAGDLACAEQHFEAGEVSVVTREDDWRLIPTGAIQKLHHVVITRLIVLRC